MVNKTNQEFLEYLSRCASISTVFAQVLVNRGLKDVKSIKDFLFPSIKNLHDPFLMPDTGKAVERIKTAMAKNETVLVCGDYDADGITSTALLVSTLRTLGLKTYYHIPNRMTEGYGFSIECIKKARTIGAGLIITVDCGISSEEEVSMSMSLGIDVIITDHHEPPARLPDALAIVNPRRADSEYPFKHLAGVGVAYKLAQALMQLTVNSEQLTEELLDLVAIGTVADSVPLTGENRILAAYGLKALNNNSDKPWIYSFKKTSGMDKKIFCSRTLSFTIIPRINAAGRLGNADEVVELFLTQDKDKAEEIALFLDEQNRKRQRIEEDVFKSALDMIDVHNLENAIVLHSPSWHQGVIGIVASRLVEMFYRPTFMFSVKDGIAKGSARSIPPFHIYKGISECSELLLAYGGHSQAAGLKILIENIPAFKEQINSLIQNTLSSENIIPTIEIDAGVELLEINSSLVKEIELLQPFGASNKPPVLGAKGLEIVNPRIVGSNHLKMRLKQKSTSIDTIGFDLGNLLPDLLTPNPELQVDIAFVPCINEWNGSTSLQLNLKALRPST
ncbi:MAG: single-stranded-DNA-specific exonuclease RecJ [Thermodesulfovibrionia bacterium]|nr:single-stranded-DNA-specific exonuclease RecJ [Thermodesulfovibrionia bacterium]